MTLATSNRLDRLRFHRARLAAVVLALDTALDAINIEGRAEPGLWQVANALLDARLTFGASLTQFDAALTRGES